MAEHVPHTHTCALQLPTSSRIVDHLCCAMPIYRTFRHAFRRLGMKRQTWCVIAPRVASPAQTYLRSMVSKVGLVAKRIC